MSQILNTKSQIEFNNIDTLNSHIYEMSYFLTNIYIYIWLSKNIIEFKSHCKVIDSCRNNLLNIFGILLFSPGGRLYRVQIDLNLIYTISSYNHAHLIYTINSYNHAHLIYTISSYNHAIQIYTDNTPPQAGE